jgi:tetratricopeptide (TPR) repeat protein
MFPKETRVNMREMIRFSMCVLILALFCAPDKSRHKAIVIPSFEPLADSLSLEKACERISFDISSRVGKKDASDLALFYRTVDSAADSLIRALGKDAVTLVGEHAILDVVYRNWKMTFDPRDDALETLLPHCAFKEKKGNCMAVSLMILMLAQQLGCPIDGVVLPGHFFCRYNDGADRVNIEPNKEGYNHPDDYYRTKYLSNDQAWYTLQAVKKKEAIGVFFYAVGTLFLKRSDFGFAAACLKESCRRFPSLVEAQGNHALALALCGRSDTAMTIFEALFEKYPSAVNLAANYGAVAMASGRPQKAFEIFKKGLVHFPNDPKLLTGLSQAYVARQKKISAGPTPTGEK